MGHTGDIEAVYTRKNLPEDVIEQIRDAFLKAEPRLTTIQDRDLEELEGPRQTIMRRRHSKTQG